MRILHFIPCLSGGGAERQLSYLVPELARMGHEVHIAYSTGGPCEPELPGVVRHRLKSRSNYDPYLLWQLIRLIRNIKPDIIHTWILQMDILGGIAARMNGIPWILREPTHPLAYLTPTWKHRLRVWIGAGASAIVSVSRGGDEYWKIQRPNSRRYIVLPGLVMPRAPIALYVGRLVALKNAKVFLEALGRIKLKQEVLGVLCGEGPQRSELEALRHKLGLDADVCFTGHLPAAAVWALMKKASIFVSLSAYEGCPNAVMEALMCGCPLTLSDIPAHREILDESCALFVDPANIQQTADTILQALRNTEAAKARALIAKQKTQEWTIAAMTRNYENVYKEVA
ncbi:MAG: glycosyltransferase [Elusimicrobia bacterium]|nr:glycosyltransferase [Elusimicrobiota bacterium]